jgi:DNA-binding NtrC family response regulator
MESPCGNLADPPNDSYAANDQPSEQQFHERPGVLVVDDEPMMRTMLQLGLEGDGFDVCLASNGGDAIELYGKHRDNIAVVLLDVRMPGLDGLQTLDALLKLNPKVQVCLMSGGTDSDKPEELRQRGAAYAIAKPFRLDQLAKVLRQLVCGAAVDSGSAGGTLRRPGGDALPCGY